eukprot:5794014-Pyramimonas_sp.AAC.1
MLRAARCPRVHLESQGQPDVVVRLGRRAARMRPRIFRPLARRAWARAQHHMPWGPWPPLGAGQIAGAQCGAAAL